MYAAIFILFIVLGLFLIYKGISGKKKFALLTGVFSSILPFAFLGYANFWTEKLWFDSVGYSMRFWKLMSTLAIYSFSAGVLSYLFVKAATFRISKRSGWVHSIAVRFAAIIGILWGAFNWESIILFIHAEKTGVLDPVLKEDAGFYMFVLPFLDKLLILFTMLAALSLIASLFVFVREESGWRDGKLVIVRRSGILPEENYRSAFFSAAILLLVIAAGRYIDRFHLLYSQFGVVNGPGWTDVNIRLPAYTVVAVIMIILAIGIAVPVLRKKVSGIFNTDPAKELHATLVSFGAIAGLSWLISLTLIPGLVQWIYVEPNEITLEKPFIENNIRFTRMAYGLDKAEEREYEVQEELDANLISQNPVTLRNIRLWDWRALEAVYRQFQEIRLYYEFTDVDIDRYWYNDEYRQVMVSAREMNVNNLPDKSQTFVNRRFKYTHGNGITMNSVSEFTPDGLPNLLIKDIPPVSNVPEFSIDRPGIYYGELNNEPVVVNSTEAEFDYPKGDQNVYVHYEGKGGVQLNSLWRKFIYGWRFDGTQFFLSSYIKHDSRILFDRNILVRSGKIGPFLAFDNDPYVVLSGKKLYWILDAYTTSSSYPYSEKFFAREVIQYKESDRTERISSRELGHLSGINYIRNSVKVVVDAYEGSIDYYVFDETDPVLKVWGRIFPGLFKKASDMPSDLFSHVRYPSDFLLMQGIMYSKYHMTDPEVFYNQEDLWVRATEKYYGEIRPVEPYYILWEQPESKDADFVLMLPFTPKNKQVMIGWIAGMCDGKNYGRFLAYKFPKEKRILGTQQVETKIDQDPFLSSQLTLWDQRGSRVIRGNVLAIPVSKTILYVEPIYLQSETAAYPELRLIAVMHNDRLSYAETFDEALKGILSSGSGRAVRKEGESGILKNIGGVNVKEAKEAFNDYLRYTGEGKFDQASSALTRLKRALEQLETDSSVAR
ncbi:MAG: UPF0182 family protein [Bacteroidetes bacterium]|nr:MAG: UPF0182 family protein [Bacteroidota bacterium]REK00970.1 MAG: UPF0182 family protein [Bacteroidota bacterium]REK34573.1 MAG: UPF0182 family protein [Bacteroidota bacterium]REK51832.1 MAG: UPF0182 family protein [Bacteroidota bacterium]